MRKILFFALALVAGALAFTSCDKKDKNGADDPNAVVFNAVGELRGVMFPVHNDQQQAVITLHPNAKTVDVKFVNARIASEDETPQDIFIHNMPVNAGETHIQLLLGDGSPYAPFPKSYAYAMMNEEQTMFNMHFGNDDEQDTQVYLVFGAMLK
ncbi:MAG: hypothetical protein IKN59_05545 [Paludibacteraceae bacterium]|nr:hypothetical protein [Paludibacteraceae bacterium]